MSKNHVFDRDIKFKQIEAARFEVEISDQWSINKIPNGGYLMAILANSVISSSSKPNLSILTANFIKRCKPGKAEIWLDPIGSSNSFDRFQIALRQEGSENIRALATLVSNNINAEKAHEKEAPTVLDREQCIQVPEMPGYTFFTPMEILLEPESAGWMQGRLSEKSEIKGWLKFREPRSFDQQAVIMASDSFPPPVLAKHGMVAWVPTIELSVNIRKLPQTEWLKCIFRSRFIDNGIVDEDGEIWDENGELIAISRQISQFRRS